MITQHEDASVRFYNVSDLAGVNLALHPIPLEHLNIHVLEIPEIALRSGLQTLRVARVMIARVSLECVVQMNTGEIVVLGLGPQLRTQDVLDDEILDLSHVRCHGDAYVPRFILKAQKSGAVIFCLSDIGAFLVLYDDIILRLLIWMSLNRVFGSGVPAWLAVDH